MLSRIYTILQTLLVAVLLVLLLNYSTPPPTDEEGSVRIFTRQIEFDFAGWMFNAVGLKFEQGAAGMPGYMNHARFRPGEP